MIHVHIHILIHEHTNTYTSTTVNYVIRKKVIVQRCSMVFCGGKRGGKVWHEGRVEEAGGANLIVFVSKGGDPWHTTIM